MTNPALHRPTARLENRVTRQRPVYRMREALGYQLGFIGFARFSNIARTWRYLVHIEPRFLPRALLISFTSMLALPLNLWQWIRYGRAIKRQRLNGDPVFIIGHWRSGTTHLHNLMSLDEQLGNVSMFQAIFPDCSVVGGSWLKWIMARIVPEKRPMDNMVWPMDAPQEEEIPLAKMLPYSFYTQFVYPRETKDLFRKYVLMEDMAQNDRRELEQKYHRVLQIATLHAGGRRLILKNPVNTARIPLLLALYPNAKFIHIHRKPYDVYRSTRSLHRKLHALTALQQTSDATADETVKFLYEALMTKYFEDKHRIPEGNLVELRFEDLERDPQRELARIYRVLALPGFNAIKPRLTAYLDSQRTYRKNRFAASPESRRAVEQRWAFAFDALGYARAYPNGLGTRE